MLVLFSYICLCFCYSVNADIPIKVPRKELNDGNTIPVIALGTFSTAHPLGHCIEAFEHRAELLHRLCHDYDVVGKPKLDDTSKMRQTINWAVELGYRHIDTAAVYMNEGLIGLGIKDVIKKELVKRDDLFITTKLRFDHHYRDMVIKSLRGSLLRLGLDYVDLFIIHGPMSKPLHIDILETWQGMEQAQRLGLTKSIGVSNFNIDQLKRIVTHGNVKPAVNQVEIHPASTRRELVAYCNEHGIAVMAYCPLGYLVPRKFTIAQPVPPYMDDPTLVVLGQKYGKRPTQIVLRYLIERGLIPIPKSTNRDRLEENIDIFDFSLTKQEVDIISQFDSNSRIFGWP